MARRIEAGPLVAATGAGLLLIALFLDWFAPGTSAWSTFEALDLVLAGAALAVLLAAAGLISPDLAAIDRRWLGPVALLALVVVASQLIDPPPAAGDPEPQSGAWLALGGALLMTAGALLSFSRVRLAVTVEGRDPRRRVAAVDARRRPAGSDDPEATEAIAAVEPSAAPGARGADPSPNPPARSPRDA